MQSLTKKTVGQQVTVSFWAKSSVTGARFHSEPQGGVYRLDTNLTTDWARYSYTISNFTGTIYLMAVDAGTTYYLDDIKLELGNVATDWSPALEELMTKTNVLPVEARDFNYLATHMKTYQGYWYNGTESIANAPTDNWTWSAVEVIAGNGESTGIIRTTRFGSGIAYSANVNSGVIQHWTLIADDAQLVHNTGTETIAGDKTFTGNVTFSGNVNTGDPWKVVATAHFEAPKITNTSANSIVYYQFGSMVLADFHRENIVFTADIDTTLNNTVNIVVDSGAIPPKDVNEWMAIPVATNKIGVGMDVQSTSATQIRTRAIDGTFTSGNYIKLGTVMYHTKQIDESIETSVKDMKGQK